MDEILKYQTPLLSLNKHSEQIKNEFYKFLFSQVYKSILETTLELTLRSI